MDKDPEKARGMIRAVIDQLRTGMDEIRAKCDTAIYILSGISGEDCNRDYVSGDILLTETEIKEIADKMKQ